MEKSRIKASVVFDRRPYAEKKFDHKQSVVVITWILLERSFLVLFKLLRFKWPFNTDGRQYKQAVWYRVTT